MHVSCAAEGEAYVAHSAAMLHSAIAMRGALEVQIHYLHSPRMSPRAAKLLHEMVEREGAAVSFVEVDDDRIAGLPTSALFTSAMWYRVYLPELLPDVDRVLYLDADAIALDSLEPLWQPTSTMHGSRR